MIIADGTVLPIETHSEENNYMKKIRKMQAEGKLPEDIQDISIAVIHDWSCPALARVRGICTCDPDIKIYRSG
jgi:hypothetical protein